MPSSSQVLTRYSLSPSLAPTFIASVKLALTCHGTEAKPLLSVIVISCAAPFHAISPAVSGAVSVVTAVVEEGELTECTIGVSSSGCDHN